MFGKKRTSKLTMGEALHGTRPGRIQSVGYMQVIPLVGDLDDDRFVSPVEGDARVSTSSYGTLIFENASEVLLLVPCHAGYVVKRAAQDHAMAHAAVVERHKTRSFDTAMCIQQTQGGLIASDRYQMMILPFALRERALEVRKQRSYDRLWSAISAFNTDLGLSTSGHLEFFLKRFRRELDEFVAEFECVPKQVGAIVLVGDQVVGVERAPSHAYWQSVWPSLIRECYGSLAIQVAHREGETPPPRTRVPLSEDVGSLDELEEAIADVAAEEERRTKELVRALLGVPFSTTVDTTIEGLTIETLEKGDFVGQVVRDGERVAYASILASKRSLLDEKWRQASPFRI
ncbi:MAG: hypothetical protein JSV72_18500 [Ralstonia sp.]|nr:MAG: hypothetical protein JSV72_18500 [Ralstonia sp.]